MIHIGDVVVGAAATKNNMNTTGTPFLIPRGTQAVYYLTTASDVTLRSRPDLGSLAVPSTLAAVSTDFPLTANQALGESLPPLAITDFTTNPATGPTWCAAFYSTGGATVKMYGVLA